MTQLPLSVRPRLAKAGTAVFAHSSGALYPVAASPKQERSMSVSMMPGLKATAARPLGNSWDRD